MTGRVSFDFTGTTVLITGGTSGIGHATASLFRDAGAQITITGTKPSAADYDADLSGMAYHQLRITDRDSVDALVGNFSQLDVLVNNAGANFPGGLDESKPDGFEASLALNLTGPYRLTVGLYGALKASTAAGGASVSIWRRCRRCAPSRWCPATGPPSPASSTSPEISRSNGRAREFA
jgi:3-oxoacyl-[acyl-carrier protein] reductase